MDYKEKIEHFLNFADRWEHGEQLLLDGELRLQDALRDAATAIETLLSERDAAVEGLHGRCSQCKHFSVGVLDYPCTDCRYDGGANDHLEWRGPTLDNCERTDTI